MKLKNIYLLFIFLLAFFSSSSFAMLSKANLNKLKNMRELQKKV